MSSLHLHPWIKWYSNISRVFNGVLPTSSWKISYDFPWLSCQEQMFPTGYCENNHLYLLPSPVPSIPTVWESLRAKLWRVLLRICKNSPPALCYKLIIWRRGALAVLLESQRLSFYKIALSVFSYSCWVSSIPGTGLRGTLRRKTAMKGTSRSNLPPRLGLSSWARLTASGTFFPEDEFSSQLASAPLKVSVKGRLATWSGQTYSRSL